MRAYWDTRWNWVIINISNSTHVSYLSGICDVKKVYTVAYSMTTVTFDFFLFLLETIAKLILLSVEKG